jgi:fructosamine-3-kinase
VTSPALEEVAWPPGLARPVEVTRLSGGWVGTSARAVLSDGQVVLVKQTPYPAEAEADGLRALAAAGVPSPPVVGVAGHVLVLAFVGEEVPPPRAGEWAALGRAVAGMHQCAGARFGWHRDNHAGRFPQRNPWTEHWPTFFVEHRVRLHLDDPTVPRELARRIERACEGPLPARLPAHPTPVLTHGDLWRGNTVAGRWLVDPEVSYADRELDLAYMQQSSRNPFPDAFWGGYREVAPLPDGFEERRRVLELHHRLLQVRHFGASQVAALDELLTEQGW